MVALYFQSFRMAAAGREEADTEEAIVPEAMNAPLGQRPTISGGEPLVP